MDFQEAFLVLFWPAWSRMLGLFVAAAIGGVVLHVLMRSWHFRRPARSTTFAGQQLTE